jgi:ABC-type sugar transport system ATPase subunit
MTAPFVAAQEISKSFGLTRALDGVSLSVALGSVHGLIGPNGSGKSTLVRMLTGMETPDRGKIVVDGEPQPHWTAGHARTLGVELVPQELAPCSTSSASTSVWTRTRRRSIRASSGS